MRVAKIKINIDINVDTGRGRIDLKTQNLSDDAKALALDLAIIARVGIDSDEGRQWVKTVVDSLEEANPSIAHQRRQALEGRTV